MAIKKVTDRERKKAGNIYCPFCKPEKVDAVWRITRAGEIDFRKDLACEKHKDKLKEKSDYFDKCDKNRGFYEELDAYSEADYSTWLRL